MNQHLTILGKGRRLARQRAGFWLIAVVFLAAMAFSTVPTPLYALYQQRDGFSPFTVTIVFAVYAVGVVVSLLLAGHVSDWVGRKRVLVPALALEVVAAIVFLAWPELPGLILARLVSGFGVGMITATATAHLHDLDQASSPKHGSARFEIVSVSANIGGLGFGPLVAGALAQFAPAPLRTPFVVFVAVLLGAIAAVALAPETVERRLRRYRPQRITVGEGTLAAYLAAVASAFVAFAVFGLFTSLAPSFVAVTLHHPGRLLAGVVVFVVFGAAALAQSVTGRLGAVPRLVSGLAAEVLGLAVLAAGMQAASLAAFLIGGAVAGAGAGLLFKAAVGTVSGSAPAERRGEALAGLFLIAYLGLIGPVVGVGLATLFVPEQTAMLWFSGLLLLILLGVAVLAVAAGLDGRRRQAARRAA